jgi:hypothetical protein
VFNDSDEEALWLMVGSQREVGSARDLSDEDIGFMYPDGPYARPPELDA